MHWCTIKGILEILNSEMILEPFTHALVYIEVSPKMGLDGIKPVFGGL